MYCDDDMPCQEKLKRNKTHFAAKENSRHYNIHDDCHLCKLCEPLPRLTILKCNIFLCIFTKQPSLPLTSILGKNVSQLSFSASN